MKEQGVESGMLMLMGLLLGAWQMTDESTSIGSRTHTHMSWCPNITLVQAPGKHMGPGLTPDRAASPAQARAVSLSMSLSSWVICERPGS